MFAESPVGTWILLKTSWFHSLRAASTVSLRIHEVISVFLYESALSLEMKDMPIFELMFAEGPSSQVKRAPIRSFIGPEEALVWFLYSASLTPPLLQVW